MLIPIKIPFPIERKISLNSDKIIGTRIDREIIHGTGQTYLSVFIVMDGGEPITFGQFYDDESGKMEAERAQERLINIINGHLAKKENKSG